MCYSIIGTNLLNMAERVSSSGVSNALNSGESSIVLGSKVVSPCTDVYQIYIEMGIAICLLPIVKRKLSHR